MQKKYGLRSPELRDFGTSFRINNFRKAAETDQFGVVKPSDQAVDSDNTIRETSREVKRANEETIRESKKTNKETIKEIPMRVMRDNPTITVKELAPILGLTEAGVRYHIDRMRKEGKLERAGSTKSGKWIVRA